MASHWWWVLHHLNILKYQENCYVQAKTYCEFQSDFENNSFPTNLCKNTDTFWLCRHIHISSSDSKGVFSICQMNKSWLDKIYTWMESLLSSSLVFLNKSQISTEYIHQKARVLEDGKKTAPTSICNDSVDSTIRFGSRTLRSQATNLKSMMVHL